MAHELPARLLAGPIVRRADPTGVWFWFVFRREPVGFTPRIVPYHKSGDVNAELTGHDGSLPLDPPADGDLRVIQLADNAWVALFRFTPRRKTKLPTEVLLGYTAEIQLRGPEQKEKPPAGGETPKNETFWLHDEVADLAYKPFDLPTFVLSSEPRRVVHGSCRRPGAAGPDAFPALDSFLSRTAANLPERPYALFLTGDQIYADDLAEALFESVQQLARSLFGYHEEVLKADNKPVTTDLIPFKQRHDYVVKTLGFTTQDEGHLLSLAEYASMYLMVWGPEVYAAFNPENRPNLLGTHQGPNLAGFGSSVGAARRVLANISTYMIFDDHDVTDDWNMDANWVRRTNNDAAKMVVGGALFVYWLFQAWGNDPDALDWMRSKVSLLMKVRRKRKGRFWSEYTKAMKFIMATHEWSYIPPIKPQILIVNTRTQRQFPGATVPRQDPVTQPTAQTIMDLATSRPILVGLNELKRLEQLSRTARLKTGELLVLVVATPLFNLPFVEAGATINLLRSGSIYDDDHELFTDNTGARDYFIFRIVKALTPDSMVAFSGDVHHSFIIQAKMEFIDVMQNSTMTDILQVTSSPIKNMNEKFAGKTGKVADVAEEVLHDESRIDYDLLTSGDSFGIDETIPLPLKGKLGHHTYIPNNNFCVVDFRKAPGGLDVEFIGMQDGKIESAICGISLKPLTLAW